MNLKTLGERFGKFKPNERRLIVIGCLAAVPLIAYTLLIEPALQGAAAKQRSAAQQQTELASLQEQLAGLRAQAADPDAKLRQDIANSQKRLLSGEQELKPLSASLVTPLQMPLLLQSLLSKHKNLTLARVNTLPVAPLLAPASASKPARQGETRAGQGQIYRHAMEITVAGGYAELTAYADELQRVLPRPLWSAMSLKVTEYPRSEMTFTLYTLSLDLPWLAV